MSVPPSRANKSDCLPNKSKSRLTFLWSFKVLCSIAVVIGSIVSGVLLIKCPSIALVVIYSYLPLRLNLFAMKLLHDAVGINGNSKGPWDRISAAQYSLVVGETELLRALIPFGLDCNAPIDDDGHIPLLYAINMNSTRMVQLLLQCGADPEAVDPANQFTALMLSTNGKEQIAKLLLSKGAKVDYQTEKERFTALMMAASFGHVPVAKVLVESGANIDLQDSHGGNALLLSALYGNIEVFDYLLSVGADRDSMTNASLNAIMLAATAGQTAMVKHLISLDYAVNVADNQGETPFLMACKDGHLATMRVLLSAGAKTNDANSGGITALMHAAFRGRADVVRFLLKQKDAGVLRRDYSGKTALSYAMDEKHKAVVDILFPAVAEAEEKLKKMQGNKGRDSRQVVDNDEDVEDFML